MIQTPISESNDWIEEGYIMKIDRNPIAASTLSVMSNGGSFQLSYSINGNVEHTTTNSTTLNQLRIPEGVSSVFFKEVIPGVEYIRLRITDPTSMINLYWSPELKARRMDFQNSAFLEKVSTYLPKGMITLTSCFSGARLFNGDISEWDTSNVTNMVQIFRDASTFNQDLSGWNVAKVTNRDSFDMGATAWLAANKPKFN